MGVLMASPSTPPNLDDLGDRPFSFYPPIVGIEHNEWVFSIGRWSEILVRNPRTKIEVWIPRAYLADVSKVDEPVMIVGLKRELEFKSGSIWPYQRRVIELPASPVTPRLSDEAPSPPSPISELRFSGSEGRIGRLIFIVLVVGILLTAVVTFFMRQKTTGGIIVYQGVLQVELGFTAQTNYHDVVRKLGPPQSDRWKSETGERQIRALGYPKQGLTILLMGLERGREFYIGAKDNDWKTVHAVQLPGGQNTSAILRSMHRF